MITDRRDKAPARAEGRSGKQALTERVGAGWRWGLRIVAVLSSYSSYSFALSLKNKTRGQEEDRGAGEKRKEGARKRKEGGS